MAKKHTILVTGANGQLGMEFRSLESLYPEHQFLFVGRAELDISDDADVQQYFSRHHIDICINCAAYTLVDRAETEKEQAYAVNARAAGILAKQCSEAGALFFHISTDYVFAGNGTVPYKETDPTHPINVYASSKLEGEETVRDACENAIIIRTSWVYSSFGKNFVKTMLRLMSEKNEIGVVADQLGCPTYAADLASAIMQIIEVPNPTTGTYHYCNTGVISWFDFAEAINQIIDSHCTVKPIVTDAYPTPALRPHFSALDTSKIRATFNVEIPDWRKSLQRCLELIGKS